MNVFEPIAPLVVLRAEGHIRDGELNALRELLRQECRCASPCDKRALGDELLHLACAHGKADIADYLIGRGIDKEALNNDGLAPIDAAASAKQWDMVRHLINAHKVNPNGSDRQTRNSQPTPLLKAALAGEAGMVTFLGAQARIIANYHDARSENVVHRAVRSGKIDTLHAALRLDKNTEYPLINAKNYREQTPLEVAIDTQFADAMVLLKRKGRIGAQIADAPLQPSLALEGGSVSTVVARAGIMPLGNPAVASR